MSEREQNHRVIQDVINAAKHLYTSEVAAERLGYFLDRIHTLEEVTAREELKNALSSLDALNRSEA